MKPLHPKRTQILGLDPALLVLSGTTVGLLCFLAFCTSCTGLSGSIESGKRTMENVEETSVTVLQLLTDLRVFIVATGTFFLWKALGFLGHRGFRRLKNGRLAKKLLAGDAVVVPIDGNKP